MLRMTPRQATWTRVRVKNRDSSVDICVTVGVALISAPRVPVGSIGHSSSRASRTHSLARVAATWVSKPSSARSYGPHRHRRLRHGQSAWSLSTSGNALQDPFQGPRCTRTRMRCARLEPASLALPGWTLQYSRHGARALHRRILPRFVLGHRGALHGTDCRLRRRRRRRGLRGLRGRAVDGGERGARCTPRQHDLRRRGPTCAGRDARDGAGLCGPACVFQPHPAAAGAG